jgi:hypothetical protein
MRYTLLIAILAFGLLSCNKDKYTTAPQIKFKEFSPNVWRGGLSQVPVMVLSVTDSEGDLGFLAGKDTAFIYIQDPRTTDLDSIPMTDISSATGKNFEAELRVNLKAIFAPLQTPDTIYYDVYIKDFAKNKSNVIRTDQPAYYIP